MLCACVDGVLTGVSTVSVDIQRVNSFGFLAIWSLSEPLNSAVRAAVDNRQTNGHASITTKL